MSESSYESSDLKLMSEATTSEGHALGMLSHIAALIALNRQFGRSSEQLADWQTTLITEQGYYDELTRPSDYGLESFITDFVKGRGLIYPDIQISRQDTAVIVRTAIWFHKELPEVFYFFDVSLEEFSAFVCALTRAHGRACGFDVEVNHTDGFETAVIRPLLGAT